MHAALFALAMIILFAVVFFILDRSFKANLMREVDDDLAAIHASYVMDLPANFIDRDQEAREIVEGRLREPDADDAFLLARGDKRLAGNIAMMPARIGQFMILLPTREKDGPHTILGRGRMVVPGVYAYVGRDLSQVKDAERGILYAFAVVFLAGLLLEAASAFALSASFQRRVDSVAETCRGIMAGRLGERIPADGRNDEFEQLGLTINAMLDRIQQLMESLRQVSTDIAHDLRTPLAHLRQKLERTRDTATTPAAYAEAVEGAIGDCDKALAIFTALLRIAQVEAGAKRAAFAEVDLRALVTRARDIYAPVMEDTGHSFETVLSGEHRISGDSQLLLQLITNLLDNAIAHTPSGTVVTLSLRPELNGTALAVSDTGPGIAECEREKVLRRFYRGERSRTTAGSGLGLSLASAIADLHGAELTLSDNAPGLSVTVRFP
ncbi:ATP-binding protein [Rhizomicrobium palustre]